MGQEEGDATSIYIGTGGERRKNKTGGERGNREAEQENDKKETNRWRGAQAFERRMEERGATESEKQ
jgi:hypothetical protein